MVYKKLTKSQSACLLNIGIIFKRNCAVSVGGKVKD